MAEEEELTIKEAAKFLGKVDGYIRMLIREGKLDAHRETIGESAVWRWKLKVSDLVEWQKTATHSLREDGRNKWLLYATAFEQTLVVAALEKANLGHLPFMRANLAASQEVSDDDGPD